MATGHDRYRGYSVKMTDINIPMGLRNAGGDMSALSRLCAYLLVWLALVATLGIAGID